PSARAAAVTAASRVALWLRRTCNSIITPRRLSPAPVPGPPPAGPRRGSVGNPAPAGHHPEFAGTGRHRGGLPLSWWHDLAPYWEDFLDWVPALIALLDVVVSVATITWILMTKTDSTSAVAWCLLVILLPLLGPVFFFFFGYQHVNRPLKRKRRHKQRFPSLP